MANDRTGTVQSRSVTKALSSVGTTVENFADRMKRKLKEQETLADQSKKESDARHSLILQALTTIRKALLETAKIKLGDRFYFELDVSDWEGWPRLDLNLIDSRNPENVEHALTITANDRSSQGLVQMNLKSGESAGRVALQNSDEFEKLPIVLKRAIRRFLDSVTPFILRPDAPQQGKKSDVVVEGTEDIATKKALSNVDVFGEDNTGQDNMVETVDVRPLDGV